MTREEAIEVYHGLINTKIKEAFEFFAPELRESEDEDEKAKTIIASVFFQEGYRYIQESERDIVLAYLEKQKEDKDELVYRLNGLMQDYIKEGKDDEEKEHRLKCYQLFWDALEDTSYFEQKEQKPISTEDMPYVADEHFFEREPADSFKYRLAEYMTKNCKKGEGPHGYSYSISSESILEMAKEELIKRGELKEQKPAEWSGDIIRKAVKEVGLTQHQIDWFKTNVFPPKPAWSEEDEKMLKCCLIAINHYEKTCNIGDHLPTKFNIYGYLASVDKVKSWLKSRLPLFKPSEEDERILKGIIGKIDHDQTYGVSKDEMLNFLKRL